MRDIRFRPVALLTVPVLAVLCLSQVMTGATAAPTAARGKGEPVAVNLRFATFNAAAKSSVEKNKADLSRIAAESPDVITLQEMASPARRKAARELLASCSSCAYDAYMPPEAVPGSTPIFYRSDRFDLLASGNEKLTEPTFVGARGAGPSTLHAKYLTWVRLSEVATNRQVWVLNNHFPPTVQAKNGGTNKRLPKRVAVYRKQMDGLTAFIEQIKSTTGGAIFVTGDFNVNYRKDKVVQADVFPYTRLGQTGTRANYAALGEPKDGTHVLSNGFDKRLIDYVYYRERRSVSPQSQQIMRGLHSDHRALLVDFKLMNRGCFKRGEALC